MKAIIIIAIVGTTLNVFEFIALWKIDERVLKLEAIVKCLESELIALRKKITLSEAKDGDIE